MLFIPVMQSYIFSSIITPVFSVTWSFRTHNSAHCFSFPPKVNEGDDDTDLQIFCVSCSHPVNPKVALRHMERCYAKVCLFVLIVMHSPLNSGHMF